jgi:enamine deaminase RidA (YjgF/YER057c/UK114 family)
MTKRDAVFPAGRQALYEKNRYSAAIRSGDLLFVSGQVGSREDGSPESVFAEQVRLAFRNLAAVLEAAGCTFDDVVDVTTFHTDPAAQLEAVMAVAVGGDRRTALPELDRGGRELAGGLRLRNQGHRAHPPARLIDRRRARGRGSPVDLAPPADPRPGDRRGAKPPIPPSLGVRPLRPDAGPRRAGHEGPRRAARADRA